MLKFQPYKIRWFLVFSPVAKVSAQLTVFNVSSSRRFVYYTYSNLLTSAANQDQYQFAAGPYLSNHRYLSEGPYYGFQCTMDAGIWYKKLLLLADWISGSHQKGKLSVGIEIFFTQRLPLSIGWQRSNMDGSQGAVI